MKELILIQKELKENSSDATVASIKKFAPGAVKIFGVKNPVLIELAKKYKNGGWNLVLQLWDSGAYEERIIAAKMIRLICKSDPAKAIELVEKFSFDIDNWAICDTLGMQSLKPLNKKYAEQIFSLAIQLSGSELMWQRRLSLVLVEDFTKQKEFHHQIKKLISLQKNSKEYYLKKAGNSSAEMDNFHIACHRSP